MKTRELILVSMNTHDGFSNSIQGIRIMQESLRFPSYYFIISKTIPTLLDSDCSNFPILYSINHPPKTKFLPYVFHFSWELLQPLSDKIVVELHNINLSSRVKSVDPVGAIPISTL